MGKHCSGVFFWIYVIFSALLIFHFASAIYEYDRHGATEEYYASVTNVILITIVLALACIHSRITYIILIVIFAFIVFVHIALIVLYCIHLATIAADKNQSLSKDSLTAAIIVLCFQILFAICQFSVLRLFYIAFKYHL